MYALKTTETPFNTSQAMEDAAAELARAYEKHVVSQKNMLAPESLRPNGHVRLHIAALECDKAEELMTAQKEFLLQCRKENRDLFLPNPELPRWRTQLRAELRGRLNGYIADIAGKAKISVPTGTDFIGSPTPAQQR